MNTVPVTEFLPTLRALVNVPIPAIMATSVVKAAQVFCRKSGIALLRRELGNVVHGDEYSMVKDHDLNIDAPQIQASELKQITAFDPTSGKRISLEQEYDYTVMSRDVVVFHADYQAVEVCITVEPTQTATQVPEVLFTDYLDGIASGAASRLFAQPDSDWSDGSLAGYRDRIFTEALTEARRFALEASPDISFHNPTRKREFY